MDVLAGSTDVTTYFQLSLLADGADAIGLTITDIDLQYTRTGEVPTAKVDAVALAATNTAHTDNRAIEVDATDQPGLYRVDWPDAAFAASAREVFLTVKCALVKTQTLRVNLTPVPANVVQIGSDAQSATDAKDFYDAGYDPSTNKVQGLVLADAVTTVNGLAANIITAASAATDFGAEIQALITGGAYALSTDANGRTRIVDGTGTGEINTNAGAIALVDVVTTLTGHTAQTGDSYAVVNSGTFGNSALKTLIDTLDNFVDTEVADIQARLPAALVGGRMDATVDGTGMESGAINALIEACFTYDATATYAGADAGSLVKQIADNAGGSALTTDAIVEAMFTYDATATYATAHAGSAVKQIADNAGGSALTVGAIADEVQTRTIAAVTTVNGLAANVITAAATAADFSTEVRTAINGGNWALDTDSNGRVRIVDGTGTGEINTNAGAIAIVDLVTDITTKTGYRLSATGIDDVWDEPMDASLLTARQTVLLASSSGLGLFSVNDASATTTAFVTNLSSGVDNFYRDMQLTFFSGILAGQTRVIASYVGATKTVTLDEALTAAPANGVTFVVSGPHTHTVSSISDAVWAAVTRTLTAATNITSTGGTTVPQTGDSYAVVNSGTFGNSALNTDLDALLARLTSTRAGYLDNLSAGAVATAAALDAVDNFVDGEITDILSRIGSPSVSLTADIAALNDITAAEVWAAGTRTLTAGTNIVLAKGTGVTGFTDLSAAQVNAEIVDALATDTYALPGQIAPSATPTLAAVLMQMFQLATNKTEQNSTTQKIYDRAGSTVMQKRTVSDDATTLTYGVLSVGP